MAIKMWRLRSHGNEILDLDPKHRTMDEQKNSYFPGSKTFFPEIAANYPKGTIKMAFKSEYPMAPRFNYPLGKLGQFTFIWEKTFFVAEFFSFFNGRGPPKKPPISKSGGPPRNYG